jgi:hypothetical protein
VCRPRPVLGAARQLTLETQQVLDAYGDAGPDVRRQVDELLGPIGP